MSFKALTEIAEQAEEKEIPFWKAVLFDDMLERKVSYETSWNTMKYQYMCMKEADRDYDKNLKSASGLVGQDGEKLFQALEKGNILSGSYLGNVMVKAVKMGESNACMKRIVAAPTAGSCGVIPAVLIAYEEIYPKREDEMIEALFVAAGIGAVIAERAFISGAAGGCQAEIGAASAMAAGAIAHLQGGSSKEIMHGAAIALKSLLGLVCDPVAGLVEVPCIKRNVTGAVNAVTAADMACAGLKSVIPPDEVIDAMRSIGLMMPSSLRETAKGGLAATPTGISLLEKLQKNDQE